MPRAGLSVTSWRARKSEPHSLQRKMTVVGGAVKAITLSDCQSRQRATSRAFRCVTEEPNRRRNSGCSGIRAAIELRATSLQAISVMLSFWLSWKFFLRTSKPTAFLFARHTLIALRGVLQALRHLKIVKGTWPVATPSKSHKVGRERSLIIRNRTTIILRHCCSHFDYFAWRRKPCRRLW